ncbi:extensin family protein [Oricola cellulosilytica]|uniref:Extensin n=1 Tax=Oricola cellulosilytica TaxID=1429082 RepID=A0A4R0PCV1_9HYPH|nr:extensin family protein [Oricola cellulosilytica]TCD15301.1 extensin [Oricola cellulosilytica]
MRGHTAAGYGALVVCALVLGACGIREIAVPFRGDTPTATRPQSWGLPRISIPGFGKSSSMPAEEAQCRRRLKRLGVSFRELPPIYESAACGIAHPVEVSSLGRTIALEPAATLNCAMAEEAARWAQGDLAPAARMRYLTGIRTIRQMSSYSCRRINGSGQWSEHASGNALDIGSIELKNGRTIDVARPGFFALREKSFLKRVRAGACDHFATVLGPGSNADHADHFHFDLRRRSGGSRYCD